MRLFVAIDLDEAARAAVVALQKRLGRQMSRSDLRWTRAEQLHVTLAFIGEVDETAGATIVEAMTPGIDLPAYRLVAGGLGAFPPHGAPRVLWLGSISGARETIELQRAVADRLTAVGVQLERRPFHAHVTLARWRQSGAADRRLVTELADTGEVARSVIARTTLYQSRLSPQGPTYAVLVQTPLR